MKKNNVIEENLQEKAQDFVDWMLSFETATGGPVIISILISNQKFEFYNCMNKRFDNIDNEAEMDGECDDDAPNKSAAIIHNAGVFNDSYIG